MEYKCFRMLALRRH